MIWNSVSDRSEVFVENFVAIGLVLSGVAASIIGLYLVRRRVDFETISSHHEVANPMVSMFATLYSVLLGFLVVCAFNRFDSCRAGVQAEANALSGVFHFASGLPPDTKTKIQKDCLAYITSVIEEEFPSMSDGQACKATRQKIDVIWSDVLTFMPRSGLESNISQELLSATKETTEKRRERIFALDIGLWPVLWVVLIFGTITIVSFTYFFAMKNLSSQMFMVGMLAFNLAVNVYLVIDFSCPFNGMCSVSSEPMKKQRANFLEHMAEDELKQRP